MHGHSGGCMSLGKGMPIDTSAKQKLNTRCSAETELLAADDFMHITLWTKHFLEAQGRGHQDVVFCVKTTKARFFKKNDHKSISNLLLDL
jgi:hypothetical protein